MALLPLPKEMTMVLPSPSPCQGLRHVVSMKNADIVIEKIGIILFIFSPYYTQLYISISIENK
jgi:hypothetical protein